MRTLAPIVLGQTQEVIEQKLGASAKPRRLWDEPRMLEALSAASDPAVAATAKAVIAWMRAKADRVQRRAELRRHRRRIQCGF